MADFSKDLFGDAPAKRDFAAELFGDTPPRSELEQGQDIVRDFGAGALRGAGSIGATILAPWDMANDFIHDDRGPTMEGLITGQQPLSRNEERRRQIDEGLRLMGANTDSTAYGVGKFGAELAGTMGVGGALGRPLMLLGNASGAGGSLAGRLLPALGNAISTGGMIGQRAAGMGVMTDLALRAGGGAISGAAGGLAVDPSMESAVISGGAGAALPIVGRLGVQTAGKLADLFSGNISKLRAKKLVGDVAGKDYAAMRAAWQANPDELTARAVADSGNYEMQALGELGAMRDPSYHGARASAEEAARLARLQQVTPDLDEALRARADVSDVNYGKAFASDDQRRFAAMQSGRDSLGTPVQLSEAPIPPQIAALERYPAIRAVADAVRKANPDGGNPLASLRGLHAMKLAIDEKFSNKLARSAFDDFSDATLQNTKEELLAAAESISPGYRTARTVHAQMSPDVNQARVMNEMQNVLKRGGGGERVQPFLDVMGRGETSLLRKANQQPRFGGIEDVLTPEQLAAREEVASQLIRDRTMAEQASKGASNLTDIVGQDMMRLRLPSLLSRTATITNKGLDMLESRIDRGMLNALKEAMKTGRNMDELLKSMPAAQRNKALMWIDAKSRFAAAALPAAVSAGRE